MLLKAQSMVAKKKEAHKRGSSFWLAYAPKKALLVGLCGECFLSPRVGWPMRRRDTKGAYKGRENNSFSFAFFLVCGSLFLSGEEGEGKRVVFPSLVCAFCIPSAHRKHSPLRITAVCAYKNHVTPS